MIALVLAAIAAETVLPSGATMFHIDRHTPFPGFAIALPLGSDADPPGKAGLARAAAIALEEHIRAMTAEELPRAFEQLGGTIAVRTGPTASILYGGAPADRFDEAMAIVFRGIAQPAIDEKAAIARASAERPADALEEARLEARRALFGGAAGEGSLTRADLETVLAERTKAGSIIFAIAGDAPLIENAAAWTAPLRAGTIVTKRGPAILRARGRRIVVLDRSDESLILIARPLLAPSNERLPALLAAAASLDVLGARAELELSSGFSSITVRTGDAPTVIAKTTRSALSALDRSRHGPSLEAIAAARKRAATRADVALADPSTHALAVTAARVLGRPWTSPEQLSAKVLAAGDAEIASAARILATGDDLAIVVVASATQELVRELAGIPGIRDVSIVTAER